MDSEKKSEKPVIEQSGRGWTSRFTGPIRYRRFADTDGGGRPSIILKFELAPGQTDLPQAVYDVLNQMKKLDRPSGGQYDSSLEFTRDTKHGRVWRLADHKVGRLAADIIDAKLRDLAHKLDQEPQKGR
jgi:hypothetical protein